MRRSALVVYPRRIPPMVTLIIQGCGTFFLASTVAGYLRKKLTLAELVLFFAAAILFVAPGMLSGFSGVAPGGALVVRCTVISKTRKNKQIVT